MKVFVLIERDLSTDDVVGLEVFESLEKAKREAVKRESGTVDTVADRCADGRYTGDLCVDCRLVNDCVDNLCGNLCTVTEKETK